MNIKHSVIGKARLPRLSEILLGQTLSVAEEERKVLGMD